MIDGKNKKGKGSSKGNKSKADEMTDDTLSALAKAAPLIAVFEERPTLITFKVLSNTNNTVLSFIF